jgi:polyphosphate kinase
MRARAMAKNKDKNGGKPEPETPAVKAPTENAPAKETKSTALPKGFSLDDEKFPKDLDEAAMTSGGYPYDKRMKREDFDEQLLKLQTELVKLQTHNIKTRGRVLILYEGRDGAGKGSCISAFTEHLNPRNTRAVALTKPTETERGQLYFQRYATHLPTAGEIVLFDRSWYNRAGVERVMGYANADQVATFLREAPEFEGLLVRDGIRFFKFYLSLGREMQLKRFHQRRHDPLKQWKLSDVDIAALNKFDAYSEAQADMFRFTHTTIAPWLVIRANDQRRARLESIRAVLLAIDYEGRDLKIIGKPDPLIAGAGPEFFTS